MERKEWTQRDGTKIAIADMTDSHLRNALRLVHRQIEEHRLSEIGAAYAFASGLRGEMAIDSMDSAIARMENATVIEIMAADDTVDALMDEARRRNLEWL